MLAHVHGVRVGQHQTRPVERKLQQQLIDHGVTGDLAEQIAEGDWTLYNTQSRICVLRDEATLIRAGLDGDRIQVVSGIPADAQLLTLSPMGNACAFTSDDDLWCADFERALELATAGTVGQPAI